MSDDGNRDYYKAGGIEAIDVVEAFGLCAHLAHAVPYLLRFGRKGGPDDALEDLVKARWWIDRKIALLRREAGQSAYDPAESSKRDYAFACAVIREIRIRDGEIEPSLTNPQEMFWRDAGPVAFKQLDMVRRAPA